MNQYYIFCAASEEEAFFRSMDAGGDGRLDFTEFLDGFCAADPYVVHILNSYTGLVRLWYIFRFYNTSWSGTLEYEELSRLLSDARQGLQESKEKLQQFTTEVAQDLGDLSVVTLRVSSDIGPVCVVRASLRWTE